MNKLGTILVVDDDEKNRKLFRDILQAKGYSVIEGEHGKEAVQMAKELSPVLILLDWQMPIMSGQAAIQILKEEPETQNIPIIVVSASAMMEEVDEIKKSGCDAFIIKPISIADFIKRVEEYYPKQ